jgi:micrococcal nuclease
MAGYRQWWRVVCLLMLLLFLPALSAAQDAVFVKYVIDGDTVILKNGKKVRYIGIDTPEIDHENHQAEPLGYAARSFNKKLIGSKRIRLEYGQEKRDQYGRLLAYVFLQDNTFVNLQLVQSGLAAYLYIPPNLKYADNLLQAQRDAMSGKRGMWGSWSEKQQPYLGNYKSKRFHLPGCKYGRKTASSNRVDFSRQWDAYWEGYSPCTKCLKQKAPLK